PSRRSGADRTPSIETPRAGRCDDAISTGLLGAVEGRVGVRQDVANGFAVAVLGHSDRDRDRDPIREPGQIEVQRPHAYAIRVLHGAVDGGVRQDLHELFAAVTAEDVGRAELLLRRPRELPEHRVAGEMPALVVDALEVVDVDHADAEILAGSIATALLGVQGR